MLKEAAALAAERIKQHQRIGVTAQQARRSLIDFTRYTFPSYIPDPVHYYVAGKLDEVVSGKIKRLIISMPPQTGKTELVSVRFPAYWLGRRPEDPIVHTSYSASLAHEKSGEARDVLEGEEYRDIFPLIGTAPDSRSREAWKIKSPHRGRMTSAGVQGPITGRGGLLGIIDDPYESWEDAQSETIRRRVWNWWQGTFRTRIWENGAIVILMTRWHPNDLVGRLLHEQKNEWEVIRLTGLCKTQEERDAENRMIGLPAGLPDPLGRNVGESISPGRYTADHFDKIKSDISPHKYAALYDGVPRAAEGDKIRRQWFSEIVEAAPHDARRVRYWDLAGTKKKTSKFTAGVLMAEKDDIWYIEHVVQDKFLPDERNRVMRQTAEMDKQRGVVHIFWEKEGGSAGEDAQMMISGVMTGFDARPDRPTGSKDVRLDPFIAKAAAGRVRLVRGPWNEGYVDEMVMESDVRDQKDATAGAYKQLVDLTGRKGVYFF